MATLYYESSFAHHGIKGQKWGVRRYQNPDGTLTAAGQKRQAAYESRELKIVDRKYNVDAKKAIRDKVEEKYNAAKASGDVEKTRKLDSKLTKADSRYLFEKGMYTFEREMVKCQSLSMKDISDERKAVAKNTAGSLAATFLGTAAFQALGIPMMYIQTPNPNLTKTKFRVSEKNQKALSNASTMQAQINRDERNKNR